MTAPRPKNLLRVAVTGLSSALAPSPAIGVIHSLRAEPMSVVAVAYDRLSDGLHSLPLADRVVELPFPSHRPEAFLKGLGAVCRREKISCLIPTIDAEVAVLSRLEGALGRMGIGVLLPPGESLKAASKEGLALRGSLPNCRLPASAVLQSRADLQRCARKLGFPLVLKGPFGGARQAGSPLEAGVHFDWLIRAWGAPVIGQIALSGEEYAVAALADRRHEPVGLVAMRKIVQDDGGTTWAGITVKEKELLSLARGLIRHFRWVGPLEMEFIKEASSGCFYLIEINNRFPAWIYLATRAGQNLPLAYVRLARGQEPRPWAEYECGLIYARVADDRITDLPTLAGLLARGEWKRHEEETVQGGLRKAHDRPHPP
ncbi:MAG: ATP-grasp domain-containing protein [Deltaproteobacteria bacterium]|nr:ATP-grasp domain-containing protein [Deltaproteobacteria bacterium]